MYRLLYSTLWYLLCPFILIKLLLRSRSSPEYAHNWRQRLGHVPCKAGPRIWLHAVSVGETVAAKPLVKAIITQYPKHSLLISNTTPTGMQTAKRLFGDNVEHCYCPYDLPHVISRFLKHTQPDLLIIMETEIWPNLLHQCKQQAIPVMIANARLSPRSTKGYTKVQRLIEAALANVSIIACRSQQDAEHFQQLGASTNQLTVSGNIKFDVVQGIQASTSPNIFTKFPQQKILVAASTHQGEDEIILEIFKQLRQTFPTLQLILVPRHPERFNDVFQLCQRAGLSTIRRSDTIKLDSSCDIILGDSLGEMAMWYANADVVFIGGSLVKTGGHNPLEATVFGVPVVSGPAVFNFQDVFTVLCEVNLAWVEPDSHHLIQRITKQLQRTDEDLAAFKEHAKLTLSTKAGVTERLMSQVATLLRP